MQFSTFPLLGHLGPLSDSSIGTRWGPYPRCPGDPAEELWTSCQRWKWLNLALFEPSDASLLEVLQKPLFRDDWWMQKVTQLLHSCPEIWRPICDAERGLDVLFSLSTKLCLFSVGVCIFGGHIGFARWNAWRVWMRPSWWHPFWSIHEKNSDGHTHRYDHQVL